MSKSAFSQLLENTNNVLYSLNHHPDNWCTGDSLTAIADEIAIPDAIAYIGDYFPQAFENYWESKGMTNADELPDHIPEENWGINIWRECVRLMDNKKLPDNISSDDCDAIYGELNTTLDSMKKYPNNWCSGMSIREIAKSIADEIDLDNIDQFLKGFEDYCAEVRGIKTQDHFVKTDSFESYEIPAILLMADLS